MKILSHDEQAGIVAGVLLLPPGYRRAEGHLLVDSEFFLLRGCLSVGDAGRHFGYYDYAPAGATQELWEVEEACDVFFLAKGMPDFVPEPGSNPAGRIQLETERLPWSVNPFEGPPPGECVKFFRRNEDTGETFGVAACVRRYDYPKIEFHDSTELLFLVEGRMWIGTHGSMHPGSYVALAPYTTHGPFYSRDGVFMLFWVDEFLVNHFTNDPRSTPSENRRQHESQQELLQPQD